MKNLIKFVYTGKAALNPQEFEVFQQMMGEFQIGMDENSAIILEEKESDDEEMPTNTVSLSSKFISQHQTKDFIFRI